MIISCDLTSDVGIKRKNNEDMVLLNGDFYRDTTISISLTLSDKAKMAAIVADGMGGHAGGEFASELATQSFQSFIETMHEDADPATIEQMIKTWATDAHFVIQQKGIDMPQYYNMGTTFVGLLFCNSNVFWINIGDSRIYRYRDGVLRQLSTDHSMRELTKDPTVPSNIIYNALGVGDSAFADVANITDRILQGDKYLMCSDGLSDMISDDAIEGILDNGGGSQQLVDAAKLAGGNDNVSVLIVDITEAP
ncbi:MAG: PP2C family protein-serine/threonine phosphatase [Prevotella sp.]